jgi:DNA repair protein RadA/Sms
MAKSSTQYICQQCGTAHSKWSGKCDGCGAWNTLSEERQELTPKGLSAGKGKAIEFVPLAGDEEEAPRQSSTISELDRVLGGGLVPGSAVLIGGDPGIGKSTLLLQATAAFASAGLPTVYISGEESESQVRLRAKRLGLEKAPVQLAAATSVRDILASLDGANRPAVAVIDSVQTLFLDNLDSAPGTVAQVRAASHELIKLAKKRGIALFLVGHVTKEGQIAGPRVLEHMVDTVLYFEGDRGHQFRILRAVKNRFGGTDEIGVFEMTDKGLQEVANPSSLFLSERGVPTSGSVVFAGMEGSRPMLVEIQALLSPSPMANPRRAVVGWDSARLAMLLAVLETRCGISLHDKEVYLNVAGGLRINEPAADMAVAAALLSALTDTPLPEDLVVFGEVGLSGQTRTVARADARLKEAEKLGFARAWLPQSAASKQTGLQALAMEPVTHLQELAERLNIHDLPGHRRRSA